MLLDGFCHCADDGFNRDGAVEAVTGFSRGEVLAVSLYVMWEMMYGKFFK